MMTQPIHSLMVKISNLPAALQDRFKKSPEQKRSKYLENVMMLPVETEAHANRIRWMVEMISPTHDMLTMISMDKETQRETISVMWEAMSSALIDNDKHITQERIESLVKFHLSGQALAEVDRDIERDNAELRADYLRNQPCYKAQDLLEFSKTTSINKSDVISKWKSRKRVFAVRYDGVDHYPSFQFEDGEPRKIIREILRELSEDMSAWQIAFWFASGSSWLDEEAPQDCLTDRDGLMAAANASTEIAYG